MEQTAVEWFSDEISEIIGKIPLSQEQEKKLINTLEQAKEMEKQQIIDFANDLLAQNDKNYIAMPDLAEQYYNETFKK